MALGQQDLTEQIIAAAFEVYRVLGYGFLEKIYQRAMQVELQARGLRAPIEKEIRVVYKGFEVGHYKSDILVNDAVIVELKSAKVFVPTTNPSY